MTRLLYTIFLFCLVSEMYAQKQSPNPGSIVASDSCVGKIMRFRIANTEGILSYSWVFDDPYSTLGNTYKDSVAPHMYNRDGNYEIRATLNYGYRVILLKQTIHIDSCNVPKEKEPCKVEMSNVFSTGPGKSFGPMSNCELETCTLTIFNRWGIKVFETKDASKQWNGLVNNAGAPCSAGTYFYILKYRFNDMPPAPTLNGVVTLIVAETPTIEAHAGNIPVNPDTCTVFLPNAYTPDSHGPGQLYKIGASCTFKHYKLFIYDRRGKQVFMSTRPLDKWDGNNPKGKPCPEDTYICILEYSFDGSTPFKKADITLQLLR